MCSIHSLFTHSSFSAPSFLFCFTIFLFLACLILFFIFHTVIFLHLSFPFPPHCFNLFLLLLTSFFLSFFLLSSMQTVFHFYSFSYRPFLNLFHDSQRLPSFPTLILTNLSLPFPLISQPPSMLSLSLSFLSHFSIFFLFFHHAVNPSFLIVFLHSSFHLLIFSWSFLLRSSFISCSPCFSSLFSFFLPYISLPYLSVLLFSKTPRPETFRNLWMVQPTTRKLSFTRTQFIFHTEKER